LIGTAARTAVFAGTATAVSGRVAHRQQKRYMEEAAREQGTYYEPQDAYQQPPPAPAEEPSYMAELERLAQLKQQGVITNDEFEAKKRQLLGI
jgi:hypothetical protein